MKTSKTLGEVQIAIATLDLTDIKSKLCKEKNWTAEFADSIESVYKGYLQLCVMHPDRLLVPLEAMDEMWHAHILDTKKYMADCEAMFGQYLHHYPYFGLRSDEDRKNMEQCYLDTKSLYMDELGIDLGSIVAVCKGMTCYTNCGNRDSKNSDPANAVADKGMTCYTNCGNRDGKTVVEPAEIAAA